MQTKWANLSRVRINPNTDFRFYDLCLYVGVKYMKLPQSQRANLMATSLCINVPCFKLLEKLPLAVSIKLVMCDFLTSLMWL